MADAAYTRRRSRVGDEDAAWGPRVSGCEREARAARGAGPERLHDWAATRATRGKERIGPERFGPNTIRRILIAFLILKILEIQISKRN